MLELRSASYRYPGYSRRVLDGIDVTLADGEIVGLTGPNGSGKTTLCLVAAGVAPGSIGGELGGEVVLDGRALRGLPRSELARSIGLVFSNPEAQRTRITGTVFEEVAFGPMNLGLTVAETIARVRASMAALEITELADRNPARLSGGQAQLVAIASILAMQPRQLVLDEPVAELDYVGRDLVGDALRRLGAGGTGMLVAEHDVDLLSAVASRVVELRDGRIDLEVPAAAEQPSPKLTARPPASGDLAIRCSGVSYTYPDGTAALDGVDLEIRAGERVAIVGRNGSGKTTLAKTWNGLLRPTGGQVEVGGQPTSSAHVAALARRVGLTFQDPNDQLFTRTCHDEVAFGAGNVGLRGRGLEEAVAGALDGVGLGADARTNPYELGPSRRRLLALACVIAIGTPVVVLDEPTMGLDVEERARVQEVVDALAAQGRAVVAISHDARFVAESFDRAIRLDAGRVVGDRAAAEVVAR